MKFTCFMIFVSTIHDVTLAGSYDVSDRNEVSSSKMNMVVQTFSIFRTAEHSLLHQFRQEYHPKLWPTCAWFHVSRWVALIYVITDSVGIIILLTGLNYNGKFFLIRLSKSLWIRCATLQTDKFPEDLPVVDRTNFKPLVRVTWHRIMTPSSFDDNSTELKAVTPECSLLFTGYQGNYRWEDSNNSFVNYLQTVTGSWSLQRVQPRFE